MYFRVRRPSETAVSSLGSDAVGAPTAVFDPAAYDSKYLKRGAVQLTRHRLSVALYVFLAVVVFYACFLLGRRLSHPASFSASEADNSFLWLGSWSSSRGERNSKDQEGVPALIRKGDEANAGVQGVPANAISAQRGKEPPASAEGSAADKANATTAEHKATLSPEWAQYELYQNMRHELDLPALRLSRRQELKQGTPRIFCFVNTIQPYHTTKARAIRDTWGKRCDGLMFFSNFTDPTVPSVRVEADSSHEGLWEKHRQTLRLVHKYHLADYDWFFKSDDDAYVLVENLKNYLARPEYRRHLNKPAIVGHRRVLPRGSLVYEFEREEAKVSSESMAFYRRVYQEYPKGLPFTVGGCGYAMNRAYIDLFAAVMDDPRCLPHDVVPDDWAIQFCMQFFGVQPADTRDEQGRERFHQYEPWRTYSIADTEELFLMDHPWGFKTKDECCAEDSIAWHYMAPADMYKVDQYFYGGELQRAAVPHCNEHESFFKEMRAAGRLKD